MKIEKVILTDCPQITEVFNKAHKPFEAVWNEEEKEAFGHDAIKTAEDCLFMLEGRETYCVKDDDNNLIAYISFRKKNDHVVWISELYVDPEYQGKGAGKMLIDFATTFAVQNNCKVISLETHAKADWAINFYVKLGFEIVNEKMDIEPFSYILDKPPVKGRPVLAKIV